jgi:hypothetical protein
MAFRYWYPKEWGKFSTGHLIDNNGDIALCGETITVLTGSFRNRLPPGCPLCDSCKARRREIVAASRQTLTPRQQRDLERLEKWRAMLSPEQKARREDIYEKA